jgi:class 3 adenylate cyclase
MNLTEPTAELLGSITEIGKIVASLQVERTRGELDTKRLGYLNRIAASCVEIRKYVESNDNSTQDSHEVRHDIRNLLNRIAGPSQMLQGRLEGAELTALRRVQQLIDDCAAVIDNYGDAQREFVRVLDAPSIVAATADPAKILVAEDDAENRRFLVEFLTNEGHTVALASDGSEALAQAEQSDFDLLLLDLGLPTITGFDVLEQLQSRGWQTPIIVITGRRGVDDAVRCIERGADDFLTKPIQIEILRARVKSSVEKIRLREREFGQFFPPKLARQFARRPSLIYDLPSRHAEVSVMFCDIRNFSAVSERLGPEKTTRWLRGVMHDLCEIIIENEGVLVDFAGDEVMAMWGAPEEISDHAAKACDTAVQILEHLPSMSMAWRTTTGCETELAIGVNSGRAMVGHVGTARKIKYGALGDVVNIGSRVVGATKYFETPLLITGATRDQLNVDWSTGAIRPLCEVRVKNIAQSVELCEVRPSSELPEYRDLGERYALALKNFECQLFEQASNELERILVDHPNDGPSRTLLARIVGAIESNDAHFDPVWTLSGK